MPAAAAPLRWGRGPERLEQRLSIDASGTIIARSGKVEYGQGIRTGFARIVADELAVPIGHVRVELGETEWVPWDLGTFGSLSTATDGQALRAAAAAARVMLLRRAGERLGVAIEQLVLRDGLVLADDGRHLSYAELTAAQPLTGEILALAPGPPTVAAVRPRRSAADAAAAYRCEGREIVLGRPRFCADLRLPGMLYARTLHGPTPAARLRSVDERAARALPGVRAVIREGDLLGVLAARDDQARVAAAALAAEWDRPASIDEAPRILALRNDAGVDARLAQAAQLLSARYHTPHIAHAPLAPSAAVADVRNTVVHLFVATQRPFGLRAEVAALLGRPEEQIHVHPQAMGGMFGRGNMNDAALEAVRLSRAAACPVLVQWSREQEFRSSPHRPELEAQLSAALDEQGAISAWRCRCRTNPHTYGGSAGQDAQLLAMTSGRNLLPPYRLPAAEVLLEVAPAAVRVGAMRSLAAAPNVFAIESFMDELAVASGQDPASFRLRHLEDARLRRVIETVCERSGWRGGERRTGSGEGLACAIYNGTYIAQVAEVAVHAGGVRLERVWCAVDAGEIIWPEGARNQIEGGIQQAASWALLERLAHVDGCITSDTWHSYPIATFRDAPQAIEVDFIANQAAPPTGTGEPGAVPIAAAIANAVYAATGQRLRELPLSPAHFD